MNKELYGKLHEELIQFFNQIPEDRVYFKIERDKKGKRYTVAINVIRSDGIAKIPASIYPKFNNVMYAYIFCVGIIHTAYSNKQAYFTSDDDSVLSEIHQLQSDSDDNGLADNIANEVLAAAMRQHNNRPQKKNASDQEAN